MHLFVGVAALAGVAEARVQRVAAAAPDAAGVGAAHGGRLVAVGAVWVDSDLFVNVDDKCRCQSCLIAVASFFG